MKRVFFFFSFLCVVTAMSFAEEQASCPFFGGYPAWGNSVSYNLNATPWNFELQIYGDTTGANIKWYTFNSRGGQTIADTVLYTGDGSNTVSNCRPGTGVEYRNTWLDYVCVVRTAACPEGVVSAWCDAQIATGGDCWTSDGKSFIIENAPASYNEGDEIVLSAYFGAYGGFHYFTWYKDGVALDSCAEYQIWNDPNNFNYSVLTIPASTEDNGGVYNVSVQDGTDINGNPCYYEVSNPKAITVIPAPEPVYMVFNDSANTHIWSDVKNWWPKYNRLPNAQDSAVIRSQCQVDKKDMQVGDLTFDLSDAPALTILPEGALTVAGKLTNPKAGDIVVKSSDKGNGTLVMSKENTDVPAMVEFYAKSKEMQSANPTWQYMGYPMQDNPAIMEAYPGAELYEWTNMPNPYLGGNWQEADTATSFIGLCMTENQEQVYTFSGLLNNPQSMVLPVPNNDWGEYPDFAFLANSWVAPIDIARMEVSDFNLADATVYIMNTGTYNEAISQQSAISYDGTALAPGQYNAIPVHAVSYLPDALSKIPSMQGFFVHATSETTLTLDYQKIVFDANYRASSEPTRIPARRIAMEQTPDVYTIYVSGFGAADQVHLLVNKDFTLQFENGWDGCQLKSKSAVHLSVATEQDNLSVAAIPEIEGTVLHFEGANDKCYTLKIIAPETTVSDLYLWDKVRDVYTPFVNGSQYQFVYTPAANRFEIVRQPQQLEKAEDKTIVNTFEKYIYQGVLYIRRNGAVYTIHGNVL